MKHLSFYCRMSDSDRMNNYNICRATKRLTQEIYLIYKNPIPAIDVQANVNNILEWHFVIHGGENTLYQGGMYHGMLIFPPEYPFSPPMILFLTPNGRFKTNERICFSLSDFHPEEWKPAFSVTTVLQGVREFMHDSTETIGSIKTSEIVKRQFAEGSSAYNSQNYTFRLLFPQLCERKEGDSENSVVVTTNSLNSSQSEITTTQGAIHETGFRSESTQIPPNGILLLSSNANPPHNIPTTPRIFDTANRSYGTFPKIEASSIERGIIYSGRQCIDFTSEEWDIIRRQKDVEKVLWRIRRIDYINCSNFLCSLLSFCLILLLVLFILTGIYLKTIL